jgi:hypothetical protein
LIHFWTDRYRQQLERRNRPTVLSTHRGFQAVGRVARASDGSLFGQQCEVPQVSPTRPCGRRPLCARARATPRAQSCSGQHLQVPSSMPWLPHIGCRCCPRKPVSEATANSLDQHTALRRISSQGPLVATKALRRISSQSHPVATKALRRYSSQANPHGYPLFLTNLRRYSSQTAGFATKALRRISSQNQFFATKALRRYSSQSLRRKRPRPDN